MKIVATDKGLEWSSKHVEPEIGGGVNYTDGIADCVIVGIISACDNYPEIEPPINMDSVRDSFKRLFKQMYDDECRYEDREIAYAFRMGFIEVR